MQALAHLPTLSVLRLEWCQFDASQHEVAGGMSHLKSLTRLEVTQSVITGISNSPVSLAPTRQLAHIRYRIGMS